jgi:hypothetical protein
MANFFAKNLVIKSPKIVIITLTPGMAALIAVYRGNSVPELAKPDLS